MAKVRDSAAMHRTVLYSCLRAKNWYSFPFDWPIVTIPKKMRTPSVETQVPYHKRSRNSLSD